MLLKASTLCSIALALSRLAVTNGQFYDEVGLYARDAEAYDVASDYLLEARDAVPDFDEDGLVARDMELDARSKIDGALQAVERDLEAREAIRASMFKFAGDAVAAGAQMLHPKRSLTGRNPRIPAAFGRLFTEGVTTHQQQQTPQRRDMSKRNAGADAEWDTAAHYYRRHLSERGPKVKAPSGSSMLNFGGDALNAVPQYYQMAQNH